MAFLRDDKPTENHYHNDRPVVVREERRGGGWGWLATLLTLAALALILWATGIVDVDTSGSANDESLRGGADVQINEPDFALPDVDVDGEYNSSEDGDNMAQ